MDRKRNGNPAPGNPLKAMVGSIVNLFHHTPQPEPRERPLRGKARPALSAVLCLQPQHYYAPWHNHTHSERFTEAGRKAALDQPEDIRAMLRNDFPSHENRISNLVGEGVR